MMDYENMDYAEQYKTRKPLPKKEVMKLKPGDIIQIKWIDSEDSLGMLLSKPERGAGDVSLHVFHKNGRVDHHVSHDQVLEWTGRMFWPALLII